MIEKQQFDAVVIGAGAGGLFTAARLAHRGYRTLVVERLDKVGGRASTDDIDGFKVNVGAIVIEVGGITQQTCEEVGAAFDIREPSPPILYRIGAKNVDVTGGGWGLLLGKLTRQGAKLVKGIGAARSDSGLPEDELSTAEWVSKYTKNEGVHGIFRNMCASVFAVGSEDLPARVFLTYFTRKSAFKRFGYHPEGTAVPKPSVGDFDEKAETELLLEDLRDEIDGFDERAKILNIAVTRDGWPPQRAVAGFDLPHDTPFEGLWNVGDAVKEYANGGTTACAETAAQLVVDEIVATYTLTNSR